MQKNIVCFGDSNTHGYSAKDGCRYDENTRWPKRLAKLLSEKYNVVEEGLSGRTTSVEDSCSEGMSGVSVITPILLSHKPVDLLIIMLGTNDTKERFSLTPLNIGGGLSRLVKKAMDTECWPDGGGKNILIVAPSPILKEYESTSIAEGMGRGCAEKSAALTEVYEGIAKTLNCYFLDASFCEQNDIDYMHLSEKGHRDLAENICKFINELFKS